MIFFDIYNKSSTINHQRYMSLCYTPVQRDSLRIKRLHGVHRRNVKRFRGGLVFKADRLLYHSSLGLKVIKKKKKGRRGRARSSTACATCLLLHLHSGLQSAHRLCWPRKKVAWSACTRAFGHAWAPPSPRAWNAAERRGIN